MTFVLPGRPRNFQYERATLIAVSFASAPPDVKKKRLIVGYVRRREPLGELYGSQVRASRVARRVGEGLELLTRGVGELAAAVTEDDIPEAGKAVDVLLPVGIDERRAVAANPDAAGPVNRGIVQRMDQRGEVAREEVRQGRVIVPAGFLTSAMSARFFDRKALVLLKPAREGRMIVGTPLLQKTGILRLRLRSARPIQRSRVN